MAWKSATCALFHTIHSPHRLFRSEEQRKNRSHARNTVQDPDLRSRSQAGSLLASTCGPFLASGEGPSS